MKVKNALSALLALALLAAPLLLAACADEPVQEPSTDMEPPPQPAVMESVPMIEDPQNEIWTPGYWALSGTGFYWVSGKVIPRPDPTAVWSAAHWVHHTYGWSFEKGHWE